MFSTPLHVATWSPDGKHIATISGVTGRVRNADGSEEQGILMNSDEGTLVSSADGIGKSVVLRGHDGYIDDVAWSPDGRFIGTASRDNTTRIWNADGSGDVLVLKGHQCSVDSIAFHPDGQRIVTASVDKTARIWPISIPLLQQALRNATTDCLTPAQRETYLLESESDARSRYEQCEKKYGRTPRDVK